MIDVVTESKARMRLGSGTGCSFEVGWPGWCRPEGGKGVSREKDDREEHGGRLVQ